MDMRKNLMLSIVCTITALMAAAQGAASLQVEEFMLSNGMRVWVNVDHSQPKVFGAVVVNAGAVDCPDTGIAHYFEHILFKGTQELGTVDYEAERVYLDSISMKYDELALTSGKEQRKAIQQEINRLNVKAADYAIPNEFNRLISKYGGSDLNAGTSYDFTYYHNTFSPQFIEQWCELNSHRLIHPVFRLFQGELETVYEEKNMYSDNPAAMMLEQITGKFFAGTPYAYPIVGSTENLKHPKLSDMEAFYKKYYVASNMGLVLSGDIDTSSLLPLLERTFGKLERGEKPVRAAVTAPPFNGRVEDRFLFPMPIIKMSILLFRAPTDFDPDAPALRVAMSLLSNENKTGLLDELMNKNRVYVAMAEHMGVNQAGAAFIMVVPKILCRAKTAENLCLEQLEKLINGEFTDEQLSAAKQMIQRESETELETITSRSEQMVAAMSAGVTWDEFMRMQTAASRVTRDDVIAVARKYFTSDFMLLHKKNGKCPVEKIAKPEYTPVVPRHAADKSAFARQLEQLPVEDVAPRLVDFERDATAVPLTAGNLLYAAGNPVNDIFTLQINFHKGMRHDRVLEAATTYVSELGTDSLDVKAFGEAMQQLGATMTIGSSEQETTVAITGRDENFEPILTLASHFLDRMKADKEKLDDIKDTAKPTENSFWDDNNEVFAALLSKVAYGQQSKYLNRLTSKALGKVKPEELIDAFKRVYDCRCDVQYVGSLSPERVAAAIRERLPQLSGTQENLVADLTLNTPSDRNVYIFDMPKQRQTLIGLYRPVGIMATDRDKALLELWGEYFGGGMSSVLFQEVREYRSMAYAAMGMPITPNLARSASPSAYLAVVGTQGDKSMQAIGLLDSLVNDMPMNSENMSVARQSLLNDVNNSYPSFRGLPRLIAKERRFGYDADENTSRAQQLPSLTQADVEAFYNRYVKNQPYQLIVVGNAKSLDLKSLASYGNIVMVKKDDIYKTKEPKAKKK